MGNDLRTARDTVGYFRLWFGHLGGAAAWSAFHLLSYLWASLYCGTRAQILLTGTTIVTALITIAATWVCYVNWRALRDQQAESPGAFRFLLLAGIFLNPIFLLSILTAGIAVWYLGTCPD